MHKVCNRKNRVYRSGAVRCDASCNWILMPELQQGNLRQNARSCAETPMACFRTRASRRYHMRIQEITYHLSIRPLSHLFSPSLMPNPLAVSLLGGGDVGSLPLRESDSRSKKSDHSSAKDSLLLELLAMSMGSFMPLLREGVDGVRRKGDIGILRLLFEVPGRAKPACSFCSAQYQLP